MATDTKFKAIKSTEKNAEKIFEELQAEFGACGEYALLQEAYYSDTGKNTYEASAVSLSEIKELQAEGYVDAWGYPDASECGKLYWDVVNPECDDESDACDWNKWDAYDAGGRYVKSAS